MKKARIVLSAVALFAVVGGAFAFKASRGNGQLHLSTATTLINGSTYYVCEADKNFNRAPSGPLSTYYTATTTVAGINHICTFPTTTAAVAVE